MIARPVGAGYSTSAELDLTAVNREWIPQVEPSDTRAAPTPPRGDLSMDERPTFGDFVLGLEGLGILRAWMLDPHTVSALRTSISRIIAQSDEAPWSSPVVAGERSVRAGYTEWVATYDDGGNPLILAEEPAVRGILAGRPIGTALDAACGTGRYAGYLDSLGHEVTGIDSTPAMLDVARAKVPAARFAIGDLTALPLADGAIDLAVCTLALTHCADPAPPIRELARVVRPGGSVVVSDIHPFLVMLGGQGQYPRGDTGSAFVRNYVHLPADYLRAFREVGLDVVQCVEPLWGDEEIAAPGFAHPLPELAQAAIRGVPIAIVWELEKAATD